MKKEIEVKFKVDDFKDLKGKIENLGCTFSEPIFQDDTIFINYNRPFLEFTPNDPFLRIRKTKGQNILTFKQGEEMNSIEHEVTVDDPIKMMDILTSIGFRPEVNVKKTRQKAYFNEYEICLDQVEGLGSFIELEKMTEENAEKVQIEMIQFLLKFGLNENDRVMNGYDTLVYLKNNPDKSI